MHYIRPPLPRFSPQVFFSKKFNITNGTRQGCPLSPLIFALSIEPLAELIRNSLEIKGIKIKNVEHKISLYADDILIICTDPTQSIPALLQILQDFSAVSLYKLNNSKTIIFPLTNIGGLRASLSQFQFIWSEDHITYLGVKLAHSPGETMQINYTELLHTFESECKKYQQICTSWIARISLVKMFLLPKFIYICRAIPYIIPKMFVDKLQKTLLHFIWNNGRSRVNKALLYRDASLGGLGVPNLSAYNIAIILDQASVLWDSHSSHKWVSLENDSLPHGTCRDILVSSYLGLLSPPILLLSTIHLYKLWRLWVLKHKWLYLQRKDVSFQTLRYGSSQGGWPDWSKYGILTLQPLYEREVLKPFAEISNEYKIPNSAFFQYLQIRHILNSITWPTKPSGDLPFSRFLCNIGGPTKGISLIYKLQSETTMGEKGVNMTRWELELHKTFTLEDWIAASQSASKLSRCINHREIVRKIHLRWYLTPTRLRHIKVDASELCWRNCGARGTHLHMWWECPVTAVFWQEVSGILSEIMSYRIQLTPELAVLDLTISDIPVTLRTVAQHVLISARFVIPQHWNSPNTLPISEVISRTNFHCHCETKLISSPLKCKALRTLWEPWIGSRFFS